MSNRISPEQIAAAFTLRKQHLSWRKIGEALGLSHTGLHCKMNPEIQARKRNYERNRYWEVTGHSYRRPAEYLSTDRSVHADKDRGASDDVLVERDRRLMTPWPSLGAQILGDPRIGYSALDKKKQQGIWK
jgi:hypothetical protein